MTSSSSRSRGARAGPRPSGRRRMPKTLDVAVREFKATVLNKGFIIGVLLVPTIAMATLPLAMLLVSNRSPSVRGSIAVIDRSGEGGPVAAQIRKFFSPEELAE